MRYFAALLLATFTGCNSSPIPLGSDIAVGGGGGGGGAQPPGMFTPSTIRIPTDQPPSVQEPGSIVSGDFFEDGKRSLIVANADSLSIIRGRGDGSFDAPVARTPSASGLLVAADVNGDHHLDLVVGSWGHGSPCECTGHLIAVLLGNGDGTFRDGATYGGQDVAIGPGGLALEDVNGDGKVDILYTSDVLIDAAGLDSPDHRLGVQLGNGDGTFQPPRYFDVGAPAPMNLTVTDVDGDCKPDALIGVDVVSYLPSGLAKGAVVLLRGNGDGTFAAPERIADSGPCRALALLDANGDGKIDLASGDCSQGAVMLPTAQLLTSNGDGTFAPPTVIDVGDWAPFSIGVGDFDRDGRPDIAVPSFTFGRMDIVLGGASGFSSPNRVKVGSQPRVVIVDDFNRDGWPDLADVDQFDHTVTVLLNNAAPAQTTARRH